MRTSGEYAAGTPASRRHVPARFSLGTVKLIGLGLFFVTGWLIGWVVERLLRGTTGRFRTLLLGATILATPVAVAGSLVGGLFGPPGVLIYGLIPYLLLVGIPRLIGKGWAVWTRHGS